MRFIIEADNNIDLVRATNCARYAKDNEATLNWNGGFTLVSNTVDDVIFLVRKTKTGFSVRKVD